MKPSSYIKNIAKTNIIKKKQRTWLSLTAICLSTAIIFTSMTLFKNVYSFSKNTDYEKIGNYHYAALVDETKASTSTRYTTTKDKDTGLFALVEGQLYNFRSLTLPSDEEAPLPFVLKSGTYPANENEILVDERLGLTVGDEYIVNVGNIDYQKNLDNLYQFPMDINTQDLTNTKKMTFHVVGVYASNENFLESTNQVNIIYTQFETINDESVNYVKDDQVHLADSFTYFLEKTQVDERYVTTNMDVVSNDSVRNYLQDTTMLLMMFIIIAAIGISMSLISVHNVIIISDKDRKKELGLLKSIGATPPEVKKLLQIELIVLGILGALLGLGLGMGVSYFVLNLFIEKIYVVFNFSMIASPLIIFISFISGCLLMYFSGMKAYSKYIYSSPISDLKDFSYEYGTPEKPKTTRRRSFEWKMFIIYNGRMKKQAKNIFYSFTLLLMTTVLFFSIFLSNIIYVNKYVSKGYDFDITNFHNVVGSEGGLREVDPEVAYQVYEKADQQFINAEYVYTQRLMITGSFWTKPDVFDPTLVDVYKSVSRAGMEVEKDLSGQAYTNIYHFPAAFDKMQFEEIKPYLIAGSLDNLTSNDVVAIYNKDHRLGINLCPNLKVGDKVAYTPSKQFLEDTRNVAAIIAIPEEKMAGMHFDYKTYPRIFAYSLDALIADGQGANMSEHIYIDLMNASTAAAVQDTISTSLIETDNATDYVIDSIAITVETNRFATFIIEALLYPLFFMLFIVSLMNINNVFVGNVHLKRNDISIMKSVGMTGSQLNMLFTFEYIEGYLNASTIVCAIFIPLAFIEGKLGLASSFDLGANIFGTLLISICLLGIIMVAPLVIMTLKKIKRILPIENLKDVD